MSVVQEEITKFEFSDATIQLFETLGDNYVRDVLIKRFQGMPVSPEMEEAAYNYFIGHSVITAATVANRGSSVTTEFLYDGVFLPSPIDNYFLQANAGRALKTRLIAIENELSKIIEEYLSKKGNVLIANLGSGPGRDVINVLSRYYQNTSNVTSIHIDKDRKSLERGKRMAISKGVNHLIEFIEADFLRYKPVKRFDIILLIGILCPLPNETCISYLRIIKRLLKEDGCLIASNASKKMLKEDPFTCFIMEWTSNWKLVYKDEKDVEQIYRESGYSWKGCFLDSYNFHIMGIGTPLSTPI